MVTGLIYGGFLFLRPKINLYLLIFLCIFQFKWFETYFSYSAYLGRLVYFVAVISAGRIILDLLEEKITIKKNDAIIKIVYKFAILLFFIVLFSNLYNDESLILGLYEIRYYLIMLILCSGIYYYDIFHLTNENFIKLIVFISLLQIPFAVFEYILAGGGSYRTLDSVSGTFGEYGSLVANQVLAIGLILSYKLETNKNILPLNSYALSLLVIIPLLLSKSRSATGFVILIIGFVFLKQVISETKPHILIRNIILFSGLSIAVAVVFYFIFWQTNYNIRQQLAINHVISYFTRDPVNTKQEYLQSTDPRMGRLRSIYESVKLISEKPITFLIGCGSGSVSDASLLKKSGHFFQLYGPLAGLWRVQYSKIIAELGIAGFFLFIFLFYNVFKAIKLYVPYDSILKNNCQNIIFVVSIFSLYFRILESPYFVLVLALFFCNVQNQISMSLRIKPEN